MRAKNTIAGIGFGFLLSLFLCSAVFGAKKHVIKIGTLIPEGSSWMQAFKRVTTEINEKTDKSVRFKIYPGGVLGDETDMIRKMHIGQIQGVVLSAPGLSQIFRETNVFQVPFLFDTYAEVDYVLDKMDAFFKKGFSDNEYILLGWSEFGFIRMMSTVPITRLEDLENVKVWSWEATPMAKAIFDEAGISAIPLSLPDVLLGLQTGLVEVVYAPPAGAISLQWFTKVSYMTDLPLSYLSGGIVVKEKTYNRLSASEKKIIHDSFKQHSAALKTLIRDQNREAVQVMQKHGIKVLKPKKEDGEAFKRLSDRAMQGLSSKILSREVLNDVTQYLEQYRKARK